VLAAIALGSNLGDRRGHLDWAVGALATLLEHVRVSPVFETEPVGVPDVQPPYLNAVVVGTPLLPASDLLGQLLLLEERRGRTRVAYRGARTLDLDLILYGDAIIHGEGIVVPHPRFRERLFVLEPLAALVPDLRDPVTGKTVAELLAAARGV
jgi:2-amino-4-hydroxy-6-hydroxymethyldihydropteridine diphosphokinase